MDISNVVVSDNRLKVTVNSEIGCNEDYYSPLYIINNIEIHLREFRSKEATWSLCIKFTKCVDNELLYTYKVNSTELKLKSKNFFSDDSDWRLLGCYPISTNKFTMEITVCIQTFTYFNKFVDDDSLTDFEMKGIDGSIRVHKIVIAAASEVFKQMITNDFKEKEEARVELPYSMCVLKDFKCYVYLNTLNNENLENLLRFAHCYMLGELKQRCINRLLFDIDTQKSLELIEFAVENKIQELLIAILKIIKNKELDFTNYKMILPICNDK